MKNLKFCLLTLCIFSSLFFVVNKAKADEIPVGTLLYRTSGGGNMYGATTNIILSDGGVSSGHVAIYAGEGKILEAINRGVVLNDLKHFIYRDKGEKFIGARIPKDFKNSDIRRLKSIISFFALRGFEYDADLGQQKGSGNEEWICSGVAEKIYESLGFDEKKFKNITDFEYNPDNYYIDITPDGYDKSSIYNKELGDYFSLNKEYSKINKRELIAEKGFAVNGLGKVMDGDNYFFFPYTQFLQSGLKDVEVSFDEISSNFDEEEIRGGSLMLIAVSQGIVNNINNFKDQKIKQAVDITIKTAVAVKNLAVKTAVAVKNLAVKTAVAVKNLAVKTAVAVKNQVVKTAVAVKNITVKVGEEIASGAGDAWYKVKGFFVKNDKKIVEDDYYGRVLSGNEKAGSTKDDGLDEIEQQAKTQVSLKSDLLEEKKKAPKKEISPNKKVLEKTVIIETQIQAIEVELDRVIDGDTILLMSGERVRYIGIDTPELKKAGSDDDECLAWFAKVRNETILNSGKITLVKDGNTDKDKYGRLLRYVYVNDIFLNKVLVAEGLAETFFCGKNWKNCPFTSDETRKSIILEAEESAKKAKRGLFSDICRKEKIAKIKEKIKFPVDEKKIVIEEKKVEEVEEGNQKFYPFNPHSASSGETVETGDSENATSTEEISTTTTEEISTSTEEVATSTEEVATTTEEFMISPIVISEFATRGVGGPGDEFVEIYNMSSSSLDISGFKLMKKSETGDSWINKTGEGLAEDTWIGSLGFFLFASESYSLSTSSDYYHTANFGFSDSGGHIRIINKEGEEMDRVGYGDEAVNPETSPIVFDFSDGGSAERKAFATSTSASMTSGEGHYLEGNSFDSNDNSFDFVFKEDREPQNSLSRIEPISLEEIVPASINDLRFVQASSTNSSVEIIWSVPANANLASSSYYDIRFEEIGRKDEAEIDWENTYFKQASSDVLSVGEEQSLVISDLRWDSRYVFAIRIFNGYNWSEISNQIATTTMRGEQPYSMGTNGPEVEAVFGGLECEYTKDILNSSDIFAQTFIPPSSPYSSAEKMLSSVSFMMKPIIADDYEIEAIRICSGDMVSEPGSSPIVDWECDNPGQSIIHDFVSPFKFSDNFGSYQWLNFSRGAGNDWVSETDNHFIMIKGKNLSFCYNGLESDLYQDGEAVSVIDDISDFIFATFIHFFIYLM